VATTVFTDYSADIVMWRCW